MKKIKTILLISLLISASVVIMVDNESNVEAAGGEGQGSGSSNNGMGLDNEFVWNITKKLSRIIHDDEIYDLDKGEIPKGRAWGTDGDRHAQNLTEDWMKNESYCGLSEVQKITIGHLDKPGYKKRQYSSKIVVNDFSLSLSHPNRTYPFESPTSITEVFPMACGYKNPQTKYITHNYSMGENDDIEIRHLRDDSENRGKNWPFGGTLTNYSLNVSCDVLNNYETIIGNVSFIESDEQIPDFQDGMVFMMNESSENEEKIADITNASGCILIYNETQDYTSQKVSNLNLSAIRINDTDNDNLTDIIDMLKNNETMIVDNVLNEEVATFTYNLDEQNCLPQGDHMWVLEIGDPRETSGQYYFLKELLCATLKSYILNYFPNRFSHCHGCIVYDSFDTHFMTHAMRDWGWFGGWLKGAWTNRAHLPVYFMNYSVGNWLWENATESTGYPRITGYLNQTYKKQTPGSPGVISYNVVGYRNITKSPDDNTVVISSRIDGFWGETPGDSGSGNAVMLGIAKYFNDYDITPKYNLTFLMTTGEEYGMRGAHHFKDSHEDRPRINYTLWLGTDELAMEQENLTLQIGCKNEVHKNVVDVIIDEADYLERNKNKYGSNIEHKVYGGTEAGVWKDVCDTIVFTKEANNWTGYHRAGANYTKGDVLDGINRTDLNITFEAFWNVTRYFCVDPDCWYKNADISVSDSDDEGDFVDTVTISYDVRSILPHDLAMNHNSLAKMISPTNDIVVNETANFTINRSEISKSFSITLPSGESPGYYVFHNKLFNSTGRINEILDLYSINYNQSTSTYSNFIFLYPYNYTGNPPVITNVSAVPDPVGYGGSVTFTADVTSNTSSIGKVKVYIYKPSGAFSSHNMTNMGGSTYEYTFNDTWEHGMYNYTIWAEDANGNETGSSQYSFNVSAQATVSVCTIKDEYGNNEMVNITDPPVYSSEIGYELLDDGDVLHIWNKYDSYYFDTSSGIQLTNHYDEYWSHNVLMLGYYDGDEWNLVYRTDELSGFNKDVDSDSETFVNATLWKDLSYSGYDFRLAIRYHLGVDDNELTVIPYIKNLGQEIPYDLGFAWEIKDIQIDMTTGGDYIEIDGTSYLLNQSLDETYEDMDNSCFYIREDLTVDTSESLYLRWDEELSYKVKVESREGQYNAPVTLGIKIGTLDVGQEKQTSLFWYDASESVYYFNSYFNLEAWTTNPGYMVDGNPSNSASTTSDGDVELCNSNNCSGTDLGTISKVELRTAAYYTSNQRDTILRPSFPTTSDGSEYRYQTPTGAGPCWSPWFDITDDPAVPGNWDWDDVQIMDCDVEAEYDISGGPFTLYCSQVELRVTYTEYTPTEISNPVPADDSNGVSLAPTLNITVSDPGGDSMDITWLSNSSGSWVAFGTNNSVGNGTYYQTMSNVSVNGQWWYWKVNVSDGSCYNESSAFKFYTGYQSKIENTGSTNFSGYLLIQFQFYNETNQSWVVADDTVNETFTRTINAGEQLGLDTVFNGNVNTSSLIASYGNGTYRVYAAFRDPDGDVLVCDDEALMEDSYEFTVSDS